MMIDKPTVGKIEQLSETKGLIARQRGEVIVRRWNDEVVELKKEITDLKSDLADLQEAYDKTMPGMIAKLAIQENKDLKEDFDKFCGHTAECYCTFVKSENASSSYKPKCDCGYQQAQERWK